MSDRYEAVAVRRYEDRDGNEKTAFTNIGVAFPMKERDGYTVRLHAMPVPDDGEFVILLMPPKPKEDQQPSRDDRRENNRSGYRQQSGGRNDRHDDGYQSGRTTGFSRDLDDDITFAPEWR
jgi:hypothetical protein